MHYVRTVLASQGTVYYPLANNARRLFAGLGDGLCDVLLACACWGLCQLGTLTTGQVSIITVSCLLIIMFVHHIIIPFVTNGYTLFRRIYRIKLVSRHARFAYFTRLIIHDLCLWIHFALLSLIVALICVTLPTTEQDVFLKAMAGAQDPAASDHIQTIALVCQIFYGLCGLLATICFVYGLACNRRQWLTDKLSGTLMIVISRGFNESEVTPQTKKPKPAHYPLPGASR